MKSIWKMLAGSLIVQAALGAEANRPLPPAPIPAVANSSAAGPDERAWRIGIALGYGERSNPLIQSDAIPVVVDLDIAWFGKRWFFDNGDVGFSLINNDVATANIIARVNSDRVFFSKTNTRFVQVGVTGAPLQSPQELRPPDRDYAVELGVELQFDGQWGQATVAAFGDVSGTHDGFEISGDYAYRWSRARWSLAPTVGVRYKSAALNDYFWGVRGDEASPALPAYRAGADLSWNAGLSASYYFSRRLRLAGSISYQRLGREVIDSPLVTKHDVLGYFGGLAYQF